MEAFEQDLEMLKDLPTQVQSELCALEERMEESLLKSQENLKDSLASMILEGQIRMQEALKKMQPLDHQPPSYIQTQNTPNFPTLITEESNHPIRTSQNSGHPSTQTTLPIPNPNHPPLSPIPVPISHPTSGYPHSRHISTISYSISHPTQSHAISHPSP